MIPIQEAETLLCLSRETAHLTGPALINLLNKSDFFLPDLPSFILAFFELLKTNKLISHLA